ncbi:DUF898 family protein [Roseivivax sp.]
MTNGSPSGPAPDGWPPGASPATTASTDGDPALATGFSGRRGALFWLALRTGALTVLTLGLYRFWMKTRLRRWYWSAIRPGGHPLEYVGDPWEKLLGFLVAVVILAFYIGLVNLVLMFLSFSLFQGNAAAYALSLLGVVPLWFYAQYRARRYILARTRWRGLRFGLEPGAWGYAARALWHWLLTLLSLGLLWPRMTFWLEKYKTDRTFFGDERMVQEGRWTMLLPALRWIVLALVLGLCATASLYSGLPLGAPLMVGALVAGLYGLVYYRVETLRRLTEHKRLGGARLTFDPSAFRVMVITGLGYLVTVVLVSVPLALLGAALLGVQALALIDELELGEAATLLTGLPDAALIALSVALYFSIFLLWGAFRQVFVTLPILRHYALHLGVAEPQGLSAVRQRPRDEAHQAEGFAEALDVGASL